MNSLIEDHYKNNRKHLSHILTKQMGDDAEDVVQEAYYRALRYSHAFNPNEFDFQRWFSRILSNVRKDFIAEKFGRGTHVEIDESHDEFITECQGTNPKLIELLYDEILEHDNENHREVLTLYFIFNYQQREVSQIVDMKPGTVNQIITRFKSKMKETYQ